MGEGILGCGYAVRGVLVLLVSWLQAVLGRAAGWDLDDLLS